MEIRERIKYLRKKILNLTQEEFADSLKMSRSNAGNIEIGRISVTERVISDICEKFNVNENWLKTGEGEMFIQRTRNQIITDFSADLIKDDGTFKKRLIEALAKLDEKEWAVLEKLAISLANEKD